MQQIGNLNNALQKRLIRPLYAHTQATPYAATLDPLLRNTDGSYKNPLSGQNLAGMGARSADAFTLQNSLVPGVVMVKNGGEGMLVHNGANLPVRAFGLLANWVGGTFDDLKSNNEIGVWRGPDSTWELLFPAFNPASLSGLYGSVTIGGQPVDLAAGADGRLTGFAAGGAGTAQVVARLIEYTPAKIIIDLQV